MAIRYPAEVHQYIRDHLQEFTQKEMAERVNALFGTSFTPAMMKSYYANHKLKAGKREKPFSKLWPPEVVEVLTEVYQGHTYKETVEILKEQTGREYTTAQIKSYYANHNLNSGMTGRFKKGSAPWTKGKKWSEYMGEEAQARSRQTCFEREHIPDNQVPVGTIRKTKDGYLIKKVKERGYQWDRWKMLHRIVWEQARGQIPEGYMVSFRDGNKENCDIDNLILITMGENSRMNHRGYRSSNPEITDVGLMAVKLEIAILDKRKKGKEKC